MQRNVTTQVTRTNVYKKEKTGERGRREGGVWGGGREGPLLFFYNKAATAAVAAAPATAKTLVPQAMSMRASAGLHPLNRNVLVKS